MPLHYKVASFEGPLDLLLHLIDQAEVDIYNIPIKEITEQYLAYLGSMQALELEPTSEFLVMAATLLSIKSKMLLPKPPPLELELDYDEESDPRAELVRRLIEYRKYKGIAEELREKELERSLIYTREPLDLTPYSPAVPDNPVSKVMISDLMIAFGKALQRVQKRNRVAHIRRDEISVKDRIKEIVSLFEQSDRSIRFSSLFENGYREEIVATFLAVLELMKMKQIVCIQDALFDDIVIVYKGEGIIDELKADEIDY